MPVLDDPTLLHILLAAMGAAVRGEMIFNKQELKRREKQRAKDASKAAKAQSSPTPAPKPKSVSAEKLNSNQYYEMRSRAIMKLKAQNPNPSEGVIANGNKLEGKEERIGIHSEGQNVQVMANARDAEDPAEFEELHDIFRRGNVVDFHFPLRPTDQETRYCKRTLDLDINPNTRKIFVTRSRIVNYLRRGEEGSEGEGRRSRHP
ncbi:hypothetical protein EV715DRAFT_296595 [Schizophyllum commune]